MQIYSHEIGNGQLSNEILFDRQKHTVFYNEGEIKTISQLLNTIIKLMDQNGSKFTFKNFAMHQNCRKLDVEELVLSGQMYIAIVNREKHDGCCQDEEQYEEEEYQDEEQYDYQDEEQYDYQDEEQYDYQEVDYQNGYEPDAYDENGHFKGLPLGLP